MDHAAGNVEPIEGDSTVRIDLQDIYRANPKAFIAASAVIVAAFGFLVVKGVSSGGSSGTSGKPAAAQGAAPSAPAGSTTTAPGVTTPDPNYHPAYASNVPSTPIDQQLASEYGAGGSGTAALEAVTPASPAWTEAYPQISASDVTNEQSYAVAFLTELLDRNYHSQSRRDLAQWISAESAGEVIPGVPAEAGDHALFAELMEPRAVGAPFSIVPSVADWDKDARAAITQHVFGLVANPDATWATIVGKGFTSPDPLMGAEDVTGVITTTKGDKTTTQHFATEVLLGSALHHQGYGSWGIAQWEVN